MSAFLYRLGRSSARHPFRVLGLWLVAAIAVVALQGSRRRQVRQQRAGARRRVPARRRRPERPVPQPGRPVRPHRAPHRRRPARRRRRTRPPSSRPATQLAAGHDVAGVTDPFAPQSAAVSADGQTAYVDVAYAVDKLDDHPTRRRDERSTDAGPRRRRAGRAHRIARASSRRRPPSSELIGVGVAIIVLLLAFGSVVAMGLPIVHRARWASSSAPPPSACSRPSLDVPEFSLILCAMIGLGVGIDYALFIVTRHRQHLHDGMSVEDAAGTAIATAGQAVLFAGTTVVIAILGLFLAGLPAISGDGRVGRAGRHRLDGRRDHAAARPARPGRHEDRQALDPPQVARRPSPRTRRSPVAGPTTSAATRCATRS